MYGALSKLMMKEYPSNLTRDQFDLFSDLLPPAKPGGRPRTVDVYAVLNAILYVLVEGVRWRALPGEFPPWQTVYTYFRNWRKDGTWQRIHDRLREWSRIEQGRQTSPSEAVIDSQSVKSAAGVNEAVGFDAGKQIKGRKHFLAVETLGLVMRAFVTAASTPEREGAKTLLARVKALEPRSVERLVTIWADGGFSGENFLRWVMDTCRWVVRVVCAPNRQKAFRCSKSDGWWSAPLAG
jgi:putative transposase